MNKKNTTKIGDKFESRSLGIIKSVIETKQLGYLSECLKIYTHKKYYSYLRKDNIEFDLTIEVWPPGANRYVMIYVIECKDYKTRVPVNKIEDFHSRLIQLGGVNVKGIFITNSPLQKGGFSIAETAGMMVIQGESSADYKILLHRINKNHDIKRMSLIKETINNNIIDDNVELIEKEIDSSLLNVFCDNSELKVSYGIDRLSKSDIEYIVEQELNKIDPNIITLAYKLVLSRLKQYINQEYGITIVENIDNKELLGSCDIENNRIYLNTSVVGTKREFFILAHEFGHFILHQKLSIAQNLYDVFNDAEYNFRTSKYELTNPKHWIEWQANYFASSLILHKVPFITRVMLTQISLDQRKGKIFLDDQSDNIKAFNQLVNKLSYSHNVSRSAIIIRLNELNWIVNGSRIKTVGSIISELLEELYI